MRINFDKKADALYIRFSEEKYFESDELREGIILDLDKSGKVIGLEILDVSKNLPKESLNKISFELLEKQVVQA
ncbi:MAG: DUF2283 domain-containing protein [Candidatus Diapherotrites archaeon]|nr:DUF2283 domain-containing protein [Candidatus Diapherotrites archaeon]